jgi:hypothetical protein
MHIPGVNGTQGNARRLFGAWYARSSATAVGMERGKKSAGKGWGDIYYIDDGLLKDRIGMI